MPRRTDLLTGRPVEGRPTERADAARNRAKVLAAAEALFARTDPRTVTMDDIAKEAGVGRATLYRRYPDPASIATALLDEHERRLQQSILNGAPPLGPGAPPAVRLAAFYEAMVELLDQHLPLTLGAETGLRRYETGAYGFWRAHVASLLDDAGLPATGPTVDLLLAPLAPDLFDYLRHQRKQDTAEIAAALRLLAEQVISRP
ncbi:MAG TPA: helix-turn-helix domain-containing protein [Kribbella sp.]|nr:helix-turn-helix domain-containing protein [Kribbella sp.]